MHTTRWRSRSVYRSARSLCLLLLTLLACAGLSADTNAQSGTFAAQLNLRDEQGAYNLAPYAYVTRDPGKTMTYTNVIERHLGGKRGEVLEGKILTLGAAGVPHWVVMTVNNQTQNESWVLNLGKHIDGRIGLIDKIFIYDHTARKRVIDTVSATQVPGAKAEIFNATAVPIHINRGKSATLVMYIVPRPGLPLTIGFDFLPESAYMEMTNSPMVGTNIAYLLFATVIGFHLAVMILMRAWGNATLILYFMAQFLLFSWNNNVTYSPLLHAQTIAALLALLSMALGYAVTKIFFGISRYDGPLFRMLVVVPGIIISLTLISILLLPADSIIRHMILAAALIVGYLFLVLISLAQVVQGKSGAQYMALGWGFVLIGAFMTIFSSLNVLIPSVFTVCAYWYALLPQALLTGFAVVMYYLRQDIDREQGDLEYAQETEQVNKIIQNREGQEFNRLKRLVEHERQVMQELRDREIQQNEETRKARVTADEANRAKSAFLAVVSHEIRTPMTGIMGMVRLLLDTSLSTAQKDYAQTIQDSGDAMMALLNDILDFEKIETGNLDLERIDFDLHRLANSINTLMSGHAKNKNIYLKLNLDPSVPRYVIGDPVRLRQVLLNLVGNSIKFTKDGGVTLDIVPQPNSEGLARAHLHKIRFAVRDTGVGISKEAQHNLFRPFSQADSSVNRKFGGTGLGLAISQRLIEAMGNRISIDSEENRGSIFHFTLIMEEGRAIDDAETKESAAEKSVKAMRILVVEDNVINQKLLKEFISRLGHEVLQALSGEEGIEAVKRERPDFVFMDLELPGISGMGATKAIRALSDDALAKTPVIALTGNVRDEDIRACYAANMNGHLAKPVDPLRLRQMIEKVATNKLDNPVVMLQDRQEAYTQTTQLSVPTAKPIEKRGEDIEQSAIMRHLMGEDAKVAVPIKSAHVPERSRLAELVIKDAMSMKLSDEELDEDTFAQAVKAVEQRTPQVIAAAPAGPPVFDKAMLAPLKEGMKPDQLKELIDGLLEKAEEIVLALDVAANTKNMPDICARAHELKGMAGNFGLTELSHTAETLEHAAHEMPAGDVAGLVLSIHSAYERARSEIARWMVSS